MCSGMLKTKVIIEIFQTQFFLFSFISELKTYGGGQGGGRQGDGRQRGGGVGHIGTGMIILGSPCLPLTLFSYTVEVFIVSVHSPEFKRSECMYIIL